jgi:hypothetical protein
MLNDETAHRFARSIVKDLLTNGNGDHGKRLVILDGIKDLGGWSEDALIGRITKHLTGDIPLDDSR